MSCPDETVDQEWIKKGKKESIDIGIEQARRQIIHAMSDNEWYCACYQKQCMMLTEQAEAMPLYGSCR